MRKHTYTECAEINFSKLEERLMAINNPNFTKVDEFREMLYSLMVDYRPTLIMATGGSKVVAYYLQLILEQIGLGGMICEVIEPRDYFYKENIRLFSNLVVISASGKSNGIQEVVSDFPGNKYLICEGENLLDCSSVSWGNECFEKEKSFVSLATSLGPITLLLAAIHSLNLELCPVEIQRINEKVLELFSKSQDKIRELSINFHNVDLIQVLSGYDTRASSSVLESNLVESGACIPVLHDKGSFCHGRSNLLFQNPDSQFVYLTHRRKMLDQVLMDCLTLEYSNVSVFHTEDLTDDVFWKEYYLILQMYFLSKKIAEDRGIDLTQPEYNSSIVQKTYKYRGEM